MAEAIRRQTEDPETSQLSFEERLALLVDQQWDWRQNKAFIRRLEECAVQTRCRHRRHRLPASPPPGPPIDPQPIGLRLGHASIRTLIVTGPCGVGKSYLACALAQKAVRDGFTSLYTRAPRLLRDLAVARADGSFAKLLDRIRPHRRSSRR